MMEAVAGAALGSAATTGWLQQKTKQGTGVLGAVPLTMHADEH